MDLIEELKTLVTEFRKEKVDYALCGGLAMAIYAFPRATMDVDILIQEPDLLRIKEIAGAVGYTIDSGLMEFKQNTIRIYRINKISAETNETITLDILLVTERIRDVWNSRIKVIWENGVLSVVSPEGLIQLKSIRGSGQDKDDIEYLRKIIDET